MHTNNSTQFIKWFSVNSDKLNLELTELDWHTDLFENYFDYNASILFNNKTTMGRGCANSKEKAIEKAISEALERQLLCQGNLPQTITTTNGLALHTDKNLAFQHAVFELIERDLFFCHYLTATNIKDISTNPNITTVTEYIVLKNKAQTMGIDIKIGLLHSCEQFSCVICFADGRFAHKPFGSVIGLGIKQNIVSAAKHAIFECAININDHFTHAGLPAITEAEFNKIQKHGPLEHLLIARSLEDANYLPSLFKNKNDNIKTDNIAIFFNTMQVSEITLPEWCKNCHAFLALAQNTDLQQLYFGATTKDKINLTRLSQFAGKNLHFSDLHLYPHPFA